MAANKRMVLNQTITQTTLFTDLDISDESKVRIVVENAQAGNTVVVRAKLNGQSNYTNIKTLTGNANEVVNVFTYDLIQIECTTFLSSSNFVKIVAGSFNPAGGSAIESIGVTSGDTLTDIESLTFTSSDNSVEIIGDNTNKILDLKVSPSFGGNYTDTFIVGDWNGPLSGTYYITYTEATHGQGTTPTVEVYELIMGEYNKVQISTIVDSFGNVTIEIPQTPDLRFQGVIIIN
jgi:hypothetical protein